MAEDQLQETLDEVAPVTGGDEGKRVEPSYRLLGDAKVPVSKKYGGLWKSRRDQACRYRESYEEAWNEAIRYYNNDQMSHRDSEGAERSGNRSQGRKLNEHWSETENVVFSNLTALIPMIYAKNPRAEFTAVKKEQDPVAAAMEKVVNTVMQMRAAPGINLKPKARRAVLMAALTNRGWMKIGWNMKDQSSNQSVDEIAKIAEKMSKAKTQKQLLDLEGQLMAIERHLDVLEPEGPFAKHVPSNRIYTDPEAEEWDLSDANWVLEWDYLPTRYLNARYGKPKKGEPGQYSSVYKPSHVLKPRQNTNTGHDNLEDDMSIFQNKSGESYVDYGYEDSNAFEAGQRTKVWYCWDKTTRRMYMYADNDWSWPIWVWEDPYGLLEFFPYYPLTFFDNPVHQYAKGEVTYYLDQQDAINEINSEERSARQWARRNIYYDLNSITEHDASRILNGPDGTAIGVKVPEGKKLEDAIGSFLPPGIAAMPELFNAERKFQAIDRISSVNDVLRGAQFKTNTTNDAIETYNSLQQTRLDEKIDLIEDWIGRIAWGLTQLIVANWAQEDVVALIGERAKDYAQLTPDELRTQFNFSVVGGSGTKPTSKAKKEEAIKMGQTLGQFADASPAVILIMLRVLQQAFDEIVLTQEDWQMIIDSMMTQQQQAGSGPAGPGGEEIPPEAQAAIEQAIQQGVPPEQAKQLVLSRLQQSGASSVTDENSTQEANTSDVPDYIGDVIDQGELNHDESTTTPPSGEGDQPTPKPDGSDPGKAASEKPDDKASVKGGEGEPQDGQAFNPANGDIRLQDGTVIRGGAERRIFDRVRGQVAQAYNTLNQEYQKVQSEVQQYKAQVQAFQEANQTAQQFGLTPQEIAFGHKIIHAYKNDPAGTIRHLLTEAQAAGKDIKIEGFQDVNASAIQQMINQALKPFTDAQDQQRQRAESQAQYEQQVNTFMAAHPDAQTHVAELAKLIEADRNLSLDGAYYRLQAYFAQNGLDWNVPLRTHIENARKNQGEQNNQQNGSQRNLPNGRGAGGAGVQEEVKPGPIADADASYTDIIREAMAQNGLGN